MKTYEEKDWTDLGIVVDEETGIAALVGISVGPGRPMPSVQLGRIIGPERKFSPYLHPETEWENGKGRLSSVEMVGSIPNALQNKINDLLEPHLTEHSGVRIKEDDIELGRGGQGEAFLGCLSCS